jgi:hypothetical protein
LLWQGNAVLAYVKGKFINSSLLQNARTMARDEIFGDPSTNVFFCQWSSQENERVYLCYKRLKCRRRRHRRRRWWRRRRCVSTVNSTYVAIPAI